MNRMDAIVELDKAIDQLEKVKDMLELELMGATYSMDHRLENKITQLQLILVDIMQADLLQEDD